MSIEKPKFISNIAQKVTPKIKCYMEKKKVFKHKAQRRVFAQNIEKRLILENCNKKYKLDYVLC